MKAEIFVIEDEKAFVDVYQRIFNIIDFKIMDWAFSGEEAIEKFSKMKDRPDLIIMDHRLPGMNGIETMISILNMSPSSKVVFVSADEKAKKESLEKGAKGFIHKPFSLQEFIDVLTDCVKQKTQ